MFRADGFLSELDFPHGGYICMPSESVKNESNIGIKALQWLEELEARVVAVEGNKPVTPQVSSESQGSYPGIGVISTEPPPNA